eukprot:1208960-Rhodomonas_salina.1
MACVRTSAILCEARRKGGGRTLLAEGKHERRHVVRVQLRGLWTRNARSVPPMAQQARMLWAFSGRSPVTEDCALRTIRYQVSGGSVPGCQAGTGSRCCR